MTARRITPESDTVHDDAAPDVLFGGAGADAFFASRRGPMSDAVLDQLPGEIA